MKKIFLLQVILIMFTMNIKSQDPEFQYYKGQEPKTLLGSNKPGGTYGSITLGYSVIDNKNAVLIGAGLNWIVSHYIGVGIAGNIFLDEYQQDKTDITRQYHLSGGYGGVIINPIVMPNFPVHVSFPVLFGAGGVSKSSSSYNSHVGNVDYTKAFLLIEPGAELELNLTKGFRMAFGASYRITTPFNLGPKEKTSESLDTVELLKGITVKLTFKFGKF
jgi:hypothetical protein